MRYLIALLAITGCDSGTFARRHGQDEAERIVWSELYSMRGPAPPVEWVDHLLWNGRPGYTIIGSRCQVTEWAPDADVGAIFDGHRIMAAISSTSYAHELMHYKTWIETGDVDPFHWRGDWNLADHVAPGLLVDAGL
jgi:hypothetical protein